MKAGAPGLRDLGRDLVKASYLKGDFVLRSGRRSNRYFDKFLFETDPVLLKRIGHHLAELVPEDTERLAAPELGAVLLGGAVSMETGLPLLLVQLAQPVELTRRLEHTFEDTGSSGRVCRAKGRRFGPRPLANRD